ncbi:HlyD family secretion protein [Aliivibrio sp. S3MY1]|uniref:efflux RND transporter periplasmic adaptor subunit n=1 Tax=unclassified Aliivibrio TaxID=2645654 RepID=UPI002379A89B|nr:MULTISPECIES: HlyD family secretion protein [unclassified Aliivibrio]MDD9196386.1 HlyD family secretion protein [Aliivibrio sp. S3MY1]MDD9199690.1 HlyD family secretion protein [Aliivibrio sp. S2MY1]
MKINKKYLFFPVVALGVITLIVVTKLRPSAEVKPLEDRSKIVNTLSLEQQNIAPQVVGFGKIRPKFEWKAIAEVSGKVVYRHPDLNKGNVLLAGTEVLRIDPLDYELKLAQAEADLGSSKTQLAKVDLEEKNIRNTLKIEKNRLSISKKELSRKVNLQKKGLTSQSDVDQQNQSYLAQQKVVQDIQNQILLLPDERKVAQAMVKVNQAKLKESQRSLDKTSIVLPTDVRISEVNIEADQVVNLQQEMFIAHGIQTMEMEAQVSIHDMQTLAQSFHVFQPNEQGIPNIDSLPFQAIVQLSSGRFNAQWKAQVERISETVDPNQATVGVILEIQQDYKMLKPSSLPPLVNGMFVKALIEGEASAQWVIPESALHGDKIYLLNQDNQLTILPVKIVFRRDNQVVISGGINEGDLLILNDLLPAINGMQLRSVVPKKELVE